MDTPLSIPFNQHSIQNLRVGDPVLLSGVIVTARDMAHQWMYDRFIRKTITPSSEDINIYHQLKNLLSGGVIYHCGPIVTRSPSGDYRFVSAGPTTSMREEPYQSEIIHHFNLKGVIGKGGMGEKTLLACAEKGCAYFHAIGGTAALIAKSIRKVNGVLKLDFGIPEAMWIIEVKDFPVVVTMDAHGNSLHQSVRDTSAEILRRLLSEKDGSYPDR